MVTRYRQQPLDAPMLADQAGRWVKHDDVAFALSLSAEEERLIRHIRAADFLRAGQLYNVMMAKRLAEDEAVAVGLAGEHGRVDGLA